MIEPEAWYPGQVDWQGLPGGGVGDHGGAEVGAFDDSSCGARDTRQGGGMWGHARSKVGGMPGRWTRSKAGFDCTAVTSLDREERAKLLG